MAYQIIRVAGYKNGAKGQKGFGGIQIHDQREKDVSHTNEDIDWERTHQNYDLHNSNTKINFAEKINERVASLNLKKALRKDANVMAQLFISASPEWFGEVGEQTQRRYLKMLINGFVKDTD
ncbi:MAG: plasmid recombination protein [Oscillospiraceae bacterium]|nr:plasmid recombination protein [Oscillospiraceae bacterium]